MQTTLTVIRLRSNGSPSSSPRQLRSVSSTPPPSSPFGGGQLVALGGLDPAEQRLLAGLDAILLNPTAHRRLPPVVWAFDPALGVCRPVRWANPREGRAIRRTALALAQLEALNRRLWELN